MADGEKTKNKEVKLGEVASVIAGQILTRVTDKSYDGEAVPVLAPKAIVSGTINRDDLGEVVLTKKLDKDKYTREGDVVIKLSTPYDAAYVEKGMEGLVIPSFCAVVRISNEELVDARYLSAFLNSAWVREQLVAKVVGSPRPMVKIMDLRQLVIPRVSIQDMKDIGKAYALSGEKRLLLNKMILAEEKLMDSIVQESIREVAENE